MLFQKFGKETSVSGGWESKYKKKLKKNTTDDNIAAEGKKWNTVGLAVTSSLRNFFIKNLR